MYSCKLGSLALLLALSASRHFILLHCQESGIAPESDYGGPPPPPPLVLAPAQAPIGLIAGAVIGSVVLIVGLFACFFIWRKRRTRQSAQPPKADEEFAPSSTPIGLSPRPTTFSGVARSLPRGLSLGPTLYEHEELELATNGFSDSNFLGKGAFGTVHKGVFHDGPTFVAIKQLKLDTQEAKQLFVKETAVINRIHHRHLVSLVGYCFDEARGKMMLVSDFVPNKTLYFHLHEKGTGTIDWKKRMKIAIGSAKGLAYLHEECDPKIIHRDIKATNILVDDNFEPKVADFGLARLSPESQIWTQALGTCGYVDPEYAITGNLTEKADVFSFGVVLLELVTGRKPVGDARPFPNGSMVVWARRLLSEALVDKGRLEDLVDSRLKNDYDVEEMFRMIYCAEHCVRQLAPSRPTMSQVVQALVGATRLTNDMEEETPARRQDSDEEMNKMRKMKLGL